MESMAGAWSKYADLLALFRKTTAPRPALTETLPGSKKSQKDKGEKVDRVQKVSYRNQWFEEAQGGS